MWGIERKFQSIKIIAWGFVRFGYNAKGETVGVTTITLSSSCDLVESQATLDMTSINHGQAKKRIILEKWSGRKEKMFINKYNKNMLLDESHLDLF